MALVKREDTQEENQNSPTPEHSWNISWISQTPPPSPTETSTPEEEPKKKSFWPQITLKDILIYGIIILVVIGYLAFDNIKGSTFIVADNPTEAEVSFSFWGKDYTLSAWEQIKISTFPFRTYQYRVDDQNIDVKVSLSTKYHFLNPTKSPYAQISQVFCTNLSAYNCRTPKYSMYWLRYDAGELPITESMIHELNIPSCVSDDDMECYLIDTESLFTFVEDYYMNGTWTEPVWEPLPEDHTFYSRRSRSDRVEVKTAILRLDDFTALLSSLGE